MSKVTKIFISLLLFVLVLFGLVSIILPHYIDPNRYRQTIEAKVQELTGRKLTIGGNIEWSLFPTVGLTLHQVELADKAEFQQPILAKMNSVSINIDLLPLLEKKLQFGRISLNNLELHVVRTAKGETNILSLTHLLADAQPPLPPQTQEKPTNPDLTTVKTRDNSSGIQFNVDIQSVSVNDSQVSFNDLGSKLAVNLKNVQFNSKGMSETSEFPFHLSFTANSINPNLDGRVDIQSLVQLNVLMRDYTLSNLDGNLKIKGDTLFTSGAPLHISAKRIHANTLKRFALDLDNFNAEYEGLKLTSNLSSPYDLYETRPSGEINIDEFNLRKILTDISPSLSTYIPSGLAQKVALHLNIASDGTKTTYDNIHATLDDSLITAQLSSWNALKLGHSKMEFKLSMNEMDMDKYMPLFAFFFTEEASANTEKSKEQATNPATYPAAVQYADSDYYRRLVLDGDVTIDRLKMHNITAGKIALAVHSEKGIYKVAPVAALLYEGQYQGSLEANYNNKTWRYEHTLDSVNVHDLLHDAAGLGDLRGTAKFASVLTGTSFDFKDAKAHMNGHAEFKVTDGAYTGFDVAYQWSQARQFIGQPVADRKDTKETPIKNLSATFVITDGIAKNDDLALYNDSIYAHGNGELNFKNDTMAFVVTTSEAITSQDANGNTQYQPKDTGLPIHLTGPITKPSLSIDLSTLKNIVLQKTGGQLINKILDKAEDGARDTGEAVKNIFKGLLGQ